MNSSKTFSPEAMRLAEVAKALAHPARIAILQYLVEQNSCVCGAIVDALPLSQATVSQHLKVLKAAGFVQGNIDGPRVCYCLSPENLAQAQADLNSFFQAACQPQSCKC
ncbi:MAG TPA: ArsR family transcriptional regulator [Bacteroidetes bacterium]|nr:ArsR family transcriptional regulator [Bacteroidota bacterium]